MESPRSLFIDALANQLSLWDFQLRENEPYTFRRKVPLGEQYVYVAFSNVGKDITVNVHAGISCFEIENIRASFHGEPYVTEEEPRAGTIGGSLYLYGDQPTSSFKITPEDSLKVSILEITNTFGTFALPYLDRFQSILDVWTDLYAPNSEVTFRLLRMMPISGYIERGIIAAFLTRNRTIFDDTVTNLEQIAKRDLPEVQQRSVKRLITHLHNL